MAEVLVLVEHVDGAVKKVTYELLTLARRIGEPAAVFVGSGADAAVAGLGNVRVAEAVTYANKDPYWQASADDSTSVLPSENGTVKVDGGRLTAELPAVSWSMIRLAVTS